MRDDAKLDLEADREVSRSITGRRSKVNKTLEVEVSKPRMKQ